MYPTPAPERARLCVGVDRREGYEGNFTVHTHGNNHVSKVPVFTYRACEHHKDMQDGTIDRRERFARMLDQDGGRYLNHPGHGNVPASIPRFRTVSFDILQTVMDQPAKRATFRLDTGNGVDAVSKAITRAHGPIAVTYDLRPELGKDIWTYSSTVEVLSV